MEKIKIKLSNTDGKSLWNFILLVINDNNNIPVISKIVGIEFCNLISDQFNKEDMKIKITISQSYLITGLLDGLSKPFLIDNPGMIPIIFNINNQITDQMIKGTEFGFNYLKDLINE